MKHPDSIFSTGRNYNPFVLNKEMEVQGDIKVTQRGSGSTRLPQAPKFIEGIF